MMTRCVMTSCMWKLWRRTTGGGRCGGGRQDTEPKTRTPHKDVGKNIEAAQFFLGRPADARHFPGDAFETSHGFGGSDFKSSSAGYIRCGQPLKPFRRLFFGISGTALERSCGREGQMKRFRWSKLGI